MICITVISLNRVVGFLSCTLHKALAKRMQHCATLLNSTLLDGVVLHAWQNECNVLSGADPNSGNQRSETNNNPEF